MVIVSKNKKHGAYHRATCFYVGQIKAGNRESISETKAKALKYHECPYCHGFRGEVNELIRSNTQPDIIYAFDLIKKVLYIKTNAGFWKISAQKHTGKYLLYHRNKFYENLSFAKGKTGTFHRQSDVPAMTFVKDVVQYIIKHDKAKTIIADDYRKLPQNTKKERHYYRVAKNKAKRKEKNRLDSLFLKLEKSNPDIKKFSVW